MNIDGLSAFVFPEWDTKYEFNQLKSARFKCVIKPIIRGTLEKSEVDGLSDD